MSKLTVADIEATRQKALEVTASERMKTPEINSNKADIASRIISRIDICNSGKQGIRDLIGLLTGLEIPKDVKNPFVKYCVVVPTKNENDHNYPLGLPVMMTSTDEAITMTAKEGNHLDWYQSGIRIATDEEVNYFFDAMAKIAECSGDRMDGDLKLPEPESEEEDDDEDDDDDDE